MRKKFAEILRAKMTEDKRVYLITADLGFRLFDQIKIDFPDRFINCGAAEVCGMGACVGLALSGKIPVFYSITPFALFRPAEVIRNYVNQEKLNVKIIGSGRDHDYHVDGFSHYAGDDKDLMKVFPNVISIWPANEGEMETAVNEMFNSKQPCYLNLKR